MNIESKSQDRWSVFSLSVTLVISVVPLSAAAAAVHDMTTLHDATRVLVNPHKGWYHHYPDNHIRNYRIARDADPLRFPGMDHVYLRLAWSSLRASVRDPDGYYPLATVLVSSNTPGSNSD